MSDVMSKGRNRSEASHVRPQNLLGTKGKHKGVLFFFFFRDPPPPETPPLPPPDALPTWPGWRRGSSPPGWRAIGRGRRGGVVWGTTGRPGSSPRGSGVSPGARGRTRRPGRGAPATRL